MLALHCLAAIVLLTLATVSPVLGQPCGSDADDDGVCDDVDNCPGSFNPTQADLDGDGDGDPCDAVDGVIGIVKLTIRTQGGQDDGEKARWSA